MRNTSTRAIAYLREQGFFCQSVEKWIPVAGNWKLGRRVDLFGIIDVLCIQGSALVGIQTFSGSTTTHMAK